MIKAEYIDRTKLKEDSEYNLVSGEYLSYSRGQIWNAPTEKVIDMSVLDKIKAEIEELYSYVEFDEDLKTSFNMVRLEEVQRVIDKYKAESEE